MINSKTIEQLRGDLRRKEKEIKDLRKMGLTVPESKEKEIKWLKQCIEQKEKEGTK